MNFKLVVEVTYEELVKNYAEAVNIARTGGSQLNMNRTMQKRPGLEKEAADAEKAGRIPVDQSGHPTGGNRVSGCDRPPSGKGRRQLSAPKRSAQFFHFIPRYS